MPSDAARQQYEKGVALFRNGDPDGSIHALKRAIELNPRFTEAYHVLGLVYFKGKRDALHAVESLNQAHQLDPDSARILNDLADVYIAQGKSQEAEQVLRKAIEAAPAGKEAYLDLARLYETSQDRAAAARIYQMLLRMHPDQTDALYNLASLYDRQGDVHGAREQLVRRWPSSAARTRPSSRPSATSNASSHAGSRSGPRSAC